MKNLFLLIFIVALGWRVEAATATRYVDPAWGGTQAGTQAQPYQSMSDTAWTDVNSALGSGAVTVYFNASAISSQTIDITKQSYTGGNLLTFDGTSVKNTSEVTPVWIANPGTNRCQVFTALSQNDAHQKHSNVKVYGFSLAATGESKAATLCGDNVTLENFEAQHTSFVPGGGPCIEVVPTADGAHEGSSAYVALCTNIVIRGGYIHDTQGEAIYVGGGGSSPGSSGSGYPSHNGVTIEQNTITRAGFWGQQGDGIDVKGGIQNLTIRSNVIFNIGLGAGNVARAIVMQGLYGILSDTRLITANHIYGCTNIDDAPIAQVDSWGLALDEIISANFIHDCSRNGAGVPGIKVYVTSGIASIINNTIANMEGSGIYLTTGAKANVKNNFLVNNNGGGAQVTYNGATITGSDYNFWVGSSWGYLGEGVHSLSTTTILNFVNAAANDYHLLLTAPAKGAGIIVAGVTLDFDGVTFASPPSVGAFEYVTSSSNPVISAIGNQTIFQDTSAGPLAFTVGDPVDPASSLTVGVASSNHTLADDADCVLGGSGASRTVTITPNTSQTGVTTITLVVTNLSLLTATNSFVLTVNSNVVPSIKVGGNVKKKGRFSIH